MHKTIFAFLALLSFGANAGSTQPDTVVKTQLINTSIGKFNFALINLENRPYSYNSNRAEIQITTLDGQPIQKIPVEISFSRPSFEFMDLNDDGYVDMLFYSSDIPNGSIPLPEAFLYIPKLNKFVKSKTLSGAGEISKSKHHGCVNVISERNINGFTDEEWCFILETGRWKKGNGYRAQVGE